MIPDAATASVALSLRTITKSFGPNRALDDVSLDVAHATVHGLLGGNGSGKSTLIKILAGVVIADEGTIALRDDTETHPAPKITPAWAAAQGLRFVHQDLGLFEELSVAENLALGRGFDTERVGRIRWSREHDHARRLLERFEIPAAPTQPLGELPLGVRTLVAIARSLDTTHDDHDDVSAQVLVLDEPTACLPAAEVDTLLTALRGYAAQGRTIVLVSHRLSEVVRVADDVSVLRDGRLIASLHGPEITEDALFGHISGGEQRRPRVRRDAPAAGPTRLHVSNLRTSRLSGVSLEVGAGEIVGVCGMLGSGRSRLLRALAGAGDVTGGSVTVDGEPLRANTVAAAVGSGVAMVPEDRARDAVFAELSIKHNISMSSLGDYWRRLRMRRGDEAADARTGIEAYSVRTSSAEQALHTLSGGNQQKVVLARWLRLAPRVLLLDEPSQGVDARARAEIHDLVRGAAAQGAAVLVVSSDYEELALLSDRAIIIRDGRVVGEVTGADVTETSLAEAAMRTPEMTA